jgi:hypothetical protein
LSEEVGLDVLLQGYGFQSVLPLIVADEGKTLLGLDSISGYWGMMT